MVPHMEPLDRNPADIARTERHGFRVSDDLAGMPVTEAELDVVEAFLMTAFRAVMAGESPANAEVSGALDSEPPQIHAAIRGAKRGRGNRR